MFKKFESESNNLHNIKIRILHQKESLKNSRFKKSFQLEKNPKKYLSSAYTFYDDFLNLIRENQDAVINIIIAASKEEINQLSNFFIDNFYENILSPNFIEDELLYLIWKLLKIEFESIEKEDDYIKFLKTSNISILLSYLKNKSDVQEFFNLTFKNVIEEIEKCIFKWNFESLKISNSIDKDLKENEEIKNEQNYQITPEADYTSQSSKYLSDINYKELEKLKNETDNIYIKEFLDLVLNKNETDENIYSNSVFLDNLYKVQFSAEVLKIYSKNFIEIAKIIKMILKNLIKNIHLFPYSLKCVCKMIYKLVEKKFKNCKLITKNRYINQFIIFNILTEVFLFPEEECLINNIIITNEIKENLLQIQFIIKRLFNYELFDSKKFPEYTIFNQLFIEIIPQVFEFMNKLINIKFTPFINDIVENDKDIIYNYFQYNLNENLFYSSYFISSEDLYLLTEISQKIKEIPLKNVQKIKKFKAVINKIKNYNEELKNNIKKDENEKTKNFLSFSNIELSPMMQELNNISPKVIFSNPIPKDEKDVLKSNLIKIENFLCSLLYNYKTLNISEFPVGNLDTITIIKELIKLINSGSFHLDESIPADWYAEILIKMLSELPEYYQENDFKNIFMTIEKDLNDSINKMNIAPFNEELEKLKNIRKKKQTLTFIQESLMQIEIPQRIINFINYQKINMKIYFNFTEEKFEISPYYIINTNIQYEKNISSYHICETTKDFINKFPDLGYFSEYTGKDLFEFLKKLEINEYLRKYFLSLKSFIHESYNLKEKSIEYKENFYIMLKNHIFTSLFNKIYPNITDDNDILIYQMSIKHSWVKPEHTISRNKPYLLYDNFYSDVKKCMKQMDYEKSPDKKREKLEKMDNIIHNIIDFNSGKSGEVIERDEILPFYYYIIIHCHPNRLSSNFRFLTLFYKIEEDMILATFGAAVKGIKEINYKYFEKIMTKVQYNKLCQEATEGKEN